MRVLHHATDEWVHLHAQLDDHLERETFAAAEKKRCVLSSYLPMIARTYISQNPLASPSISRHLLMAQLWLLARLMAPILNPSDMEEDLVFLFVTILAYYLWWLTLC